MKVDNRGVRMKFVVALVLVLASAPSAFAGPFGLSMGDSVSSLGATPTDVPGVYRLAKPPRPNSAMDFYTLVSIPSTGLCKVSAVTINNERDADGSSLRAQFEDISSAISDKYGPPRNTYDFLKDGSIWKDSIDYTMSIHQNERTLASFWSFENGRASSDHISNIMIEAKALGRDTNYVRVSYEFENSDKCIDSLREKDKSTF